MAMPQSDGLNPPKQNQEVNKKIIASAVDPERPKKRRRRRRRKPRGEFANAPREASLTAGMTGQIKKQLHEKLPPKPSAEKSETVKKEEPIRKSEPVQRENVKRSEAPLKENVKKAEPAPKEYVKEEELPPKEEEKAEIVLDEEESKDQPPIPVGKLREKPEEEEILKPEEGIVMEPEYEPEPLPENETLSETEFKPEMETETETIEPESKQEIESSETEKTSAAVETRKQKEEAYSETEELPEQKPFVWPDLSRIIVPLLIVLLLGGGGYFAYTQKWHEGVINFAGSFFGSKPAEKITVNYDENMLKSFGIFTANFFAVNTGSVNDIIPVQIRMADLFGYLKDPKVQGETGISAATFFGQLEDEAADINQFVVYMQFLEKLQNLFKTDVYAMLDRTSDRSRALLDYLDQLKVARDQGNDLLARIKISMDQFTVSYTSLSPDKTKYETDFFTAMAALESEKSDMLLKGFIDISQKQTALKSRVSALSKLIEYYDAALARLDKRITAVDQNLDALIAGIHVVDVPGAELNIIIKTVTTK